MDDQFLHDLRRQPNPEFAARLRASLRDRPSRAARVAAVPPFGKWLALAASIAAVGFVLTLPAVRAGAQAFLDFFRIAGVQGIAFSPDRVRERVEGLEGLDLESLFGGQVEILSEPQPPVSYANPEEAGAAAGVDLRLPAWVPPGWTLSSAEVSGEHAARFTVQTADLRLLLDQLGLDDVRLPEGLDGEHATVHVPPIVSITYRNADAQLQLIEAMSPEVSFPAGLDLGLLAEAGLRVLGLDRDAAYRLAHSIDWRNTLIVPVPADAASFRQVDVAGSQGLLIEGFARDGQRGQSAVLWSAQGQVYGLAAPLGSLEVLEMAQTLQ